MISKNKLIPPKRLPNFYNNSVCISRRNFKLRKNSWAAGDAMNRLSTCTIKLSSFQFAGNIESHNKKEHQEKIVM